LGITTVVIVNVIVVIVIVIIINLSTIILLVVIVVIILTTPTIKYEFVNQPLHVQSQRWLKELFLSFNPLETLPESMSALEALEDDDSEKAIAVVLFVLFGNGSCTWSLVISTHPVLGCFFLCVSC